MNSRSLAWSKRLTTRSMGDSRQCSLSRQHRLLRKVWSGTIMKASTISRVMMGLLALCLALARVTPGDAKTGVAVQKVQIADGIYQFITAPDGYVPNGNSIVIVNQDDVLVFDDFSRPSTARTELAEIRKITDKPVRYVVNSHHHPDHWSGNEVYAEAFPNLEIIASEESRTL